jgi:hypothetical protein
MYADLFVNMGFRVPPAAAAPSPPPLRSHVTPRAIFYFEVLLSLTSLT